MELALQLTHNSRLSIGYQTVTDAHKNKGTKRVPIVSYELHIIGLPKTTTHQVLVIL